MAAWQPAAEQWRLTNTGVAKAQALPRLSSRRLELPLTASCPCSMPVTTPSTSAGQTAVACSPVELHPSFQQVRAPATMPVFHEVTMLADVAEQAHAACGLWALCCERHCLAGVQMRERILLPDLSLCLNDAGGLNVNII